MGKTSTRSDSKSDRKFEKKLQFYFKVKEAVTSLSTHKSITKNKNKQKRRQKKLKAYNLSSLLESLPELKAPRREDDFKLTSKSRQKLVLKEGEIMSAFLKDPSFQKDPLAAILDHLQSTQPVVEEQPKKKVNVNGSKKKKKMKKSKAGTGLQSMDM